MRDVKIQPITTEQLDYVMSFKISPSTCATMSYWGSPPPGSEILKISPDRGKTCQFYQWTISTYGEGSARVVGIRVYDPVEEVHKEDAYVYSAGSLRMAACMKGSIERLLPQYVHTHHTKNPPVPPT